MSLIRADFCCVKTLMSRPFAAPFASEIQEPEKWFPKAINYALLLTVCALFFPLLIGTGVAKDPYSEWNDGYFVSVVFLYKRSSINVVFFFYYHL